MPKLTTLFAGLLTACLTTIAATAQAGTGASGCDDLGGIAETPMVDFQSQIQPIFANCTACHNSNGLAGLDLRSGEAYGNLVGVISTTNQNRLRVEAFAPDSSALLLAVNCQSPGGPGFQMGNLAPADRALIRDWIAQGALPEPAGAPAEPLPIPVDNPWAIAALIGLLALLAGLQLGRGRPG